MHHMRQWGIIFPIALLLHLPNLSRQLAKSTTTPFGIIQRTPNKVNTMLYSSRANLKFGTQWQSQMSLAIDPLYNQRLKLALLPFSHLLLAYIHFYSKKYTSNVSKLSCLTFPFTKWSIAWRTLVDSEGIYITWFESNKHILISKI